MISLFESGVEVETRIRARPATVFAFLTESALYRRWMGDDVELDPRPGGRYRVGIPGRPVIEGTYLVIEPPDRVVFTWGWVGSPDVPPGSTTVEVTFVADGDDTIVRLVHRGLPTDTAETQHADGWHHYAGRLAIAAGGGDPGSDPAATIEEASA
jgi:uncharacterized protein YndB with AHSA1/START domain